MITSTSNGKIKHVAQLLQSAKTRKQEKCFVVEGIRMVREIPKDRIMECFVAESFVDEEGVLDGINIELVSDVVFKKMSDTITPQGVLCVVRFDNSNPDDFLREHSEGQLRILVLERVQDPGNLGTMIRTAEGAGFDAIIADDNTVDVYNPKVTRSTMGSLFRVPVMYTSDLLSVVDKLRSTGITVCAAHLRGTTDYNRAQYGNRVAVLIGNEGNGLSDEIAAKSSLLVKIPMEGKVESLNAAVAAALMMYQVKEEIL